MRDARDGARARALTLIGRVMDSGLVGETRNQAGLYPEFGVIPGSGPAFEDAERARFESLVSFGVLPFAGVFLDAEGRVGGPATDVILRAHGAAGYTDAQTDRSVEHVSATTDFLSFCLANGRRSIAARFLDDYVFAWLPAWAGAVARQNEPPYGHIARLALDLLLDFRETISESEHPPSPPEAPAEMSIVLEPPDVLDDPSAGVGDVSRFLSTHCWTGVYIGRADIAHIGRSARAPRGFGSRTLMLENLFRSASSYGQMDLVVGQLSKRCKEAEEIWLELAEGPGSLPAWSLLWRDRIEGTRALLDHVRKELVEDQGADSA